MASSFWKILKLPQFLTYALAGAFSFAGLFTYVAGSPILFIDGFHMGPKAFGLVFAGLVLGFIGGNQVNVVVLRWFTSQQIFFVALIVQVLTGIIFFGATLAHWTSLISTLVLFFIILSSIGFTYPNSAALALAPFSREAGRASALLGFLQTGTGALISMAVGVLGPSAVVSLVASTAALALVILLAGRTRIREIVENEDPDLVAIH